MSLMDGVAAGAGAGGPVHVIPTGLKDDATPNRGHRVRT